MILLAVCAWILLVTLVAGLCAVARDGDRRPGLGAPEAAAPQPSQPEMAAPSLLGSDRVAG